MSNATNLVSRETRAGLLLVSIEDGKLSATLAGAKVEPWMGQLPKGAPAAGPLGRFGGSIGCKINGPLCLLYAAEVKAINAALGAHADAVQAAKLATLPGQREALAVALYNCEAGAYPGSAAAMAEGRALKALADFDAAHPEVIAAIRAESRPQSGEAGLEGRQ